MLKSITDIDGGLMSIVVMRKIVRSHQRLPGMMASMRCRSLTPDDTRRYGKTVVPRQEDHVVSPIALQVSPTCTITVSRRDALAQSTC